MEDLAKLCVNSIERDYRYHWNRIDVYVKNAKVINHYSQMYGSNEIIVHGLDNVNSDADKGGGNNHDSLGSGKNDVPLPALASSSSQNKTLGKDWFNLAPAEMTDELRADLRVIRLRNYINPKAFFKSATGISTVLHTGTVIEGPFEYTSSRISRKDRKRSVADEVVVDSNIKMYTKKSYNNIQVEKGMSKKVGKDKAEKIPRKVRKLL
jgi:hypothetical protein